MVQIQRAVSAGNRGIRSKGNMSTSGQMDTFFTEEIF